MHAQRRGYADRETFILGPQTTSADPAYLPSQQSLALPLHLKLSHIFSHGFVVTHNFHSFPFHLPSDSLSHLLGSIISSGSESPGRKPQGIFTPNLCGSV